MKVTIDTTSGMLSMESQIVLGVSGPYYYAYWKIDNGRLGKKYIGKYRHPLENPDASRGDGEKVIAQSVMFPPTVDQTYQHRSTLIG